MGDIVKRWVCPLCNGGALAPAAPRADDVRGYCLACSKRTGRLVRRTCPSLVRERGARREAQRADAKATRAKATAREVAAWTACALDVRIVARRCWRALGQRSELPAIKLRRRVSRGTCGRAYFGERRVVLSIGPDCDTAKLWELVLHELAHIAAPEPGEPHGFGFARMMSRGAVVLWDFGLPIERGYGPSRLLERRLRDRFRAAGTLVERAVDPPRAEAAERQERNGVHIERLEPGSWGARPLALHHRFRDGTHERVGVSLREARALANAGAVPCPEDCPCREEG
jgi:hypothetical protein